MSDHTLRPSIEHALSARKWSFVKLAEETGINRSVFSNTLRAKDPTPISFSLLKKMTLALGYAEDYFFEAYINECFLGGKSNKSRVRPFLIRCGELGKTDDIERVLERLEAENEERHLELIFGIAEELTGIEKNLEVLNFYEWITRLEKNIQSEKMAVSQYRIFTLLRNKDSDTNLKILENFIPFLRFLPDELQLQALLETTNLYIILARYQDASYLADEMIDLCRKLFGTSSLPKQTKFNQKYPLKKPPVYFYGHAYILKESIFEAKGLYKEAFSCHEYYANLDWISNPNQHAEHFHYIKKFKFYAEANQYSLKLLIGDTSVLQDYTKLLDQYPSEILPSVINVLTAAEKFNLIIDEFLDRFSLSFKEHLEISNNPYNPLIIRTRYIVFLQKLSTYHYNRGRHEEALQAAIQSWELSKTTNNHSHLRMLASLAVMYNTAPAE